MDETMIKLGVPSCDVIVGFEFCEEPSESLRNPGYFT